jgi:hypothetical protein
VIFLIGATGPNLLYNRPFLIWLIKTQRVLIWLIKNTKGIGWRKETKIIGKATHFKLLDKLKSNTELFNHVTMGYGLNKRSIQLERIYNISKVKTCYDPLTLERLKIRAIFF